ncbi:MAG: ATP-binding protein [Bacteroidota bacterium]|nr:ATP-binding protein [Candidatus Kapabacteria bacterium]MDW8220324.1 ATP-binding protein [Bacteroidota bacterium]
MIYAQPSATLQFKVNLYKTKHGLAANATKALAQDASNILWIGSDEGLSRFDGTRFRNFRHSLTSRYVKYLYRTRSNRILVAHDLGIAEIRETLDTIQFVEIIRGERTETDSTINYPKQFFEDNDGALWIAESKSVVRLHNGKIRRYAFPPYCQTNSFLRSFSFALDSSGSMIVCSQTGYVYWYDRKADIFHPLELPEHPAPLEGASDIIVVAKGCFWIGYAEGVYELHIDEKGHLQRAQRRIALDGVSTLCRIHDGSLLIGTWFSGVYRVQQPYVAALEHHPTRQTKLIPVQHCDIPMTTVNMMLAGSHGEVWISSDEGIALLKPLFVEPIVLPRRSSHYIQAVVQDSLETLYVSDGQSVFRIRAHALDTQIMQSNRPITQWKVEYLMQAGTADILSLAYARGALWCGTVDGKLYRVRRTRLDTRYISSRGVRYDSITTMSKTARNPTLFYLYADVSGTVWATAELESGVLRIMPSPYSTDREPQVRLYDARHGLPSVVRSVRESPQGVVFVGARSSTRMQYLFRYDAACDCFEDVSKPFPVLQEYSAGVEINDLFVRSEHDVWLCTGVGLFHYTASSVEKVPLYYTPTGEEVVNMKAIASDEEGRLWIGTSQGVVVYRGNNDYFFINENAGLPANEIAFRALHWRRHDSTMWIGTAEGLVAMRSAYTRLLQVPMPVPTFFKVNGVAESLTALYPHHRTVQHAMRYGYYDAQGNIVFPHGSDIQIGFLSVLYGEDGVYYQYRLISEQSSDTLWSVPHKENVAAFLTLNTGQYRLEVRAIDSQGYQWSMPLVLQFRIDSAWYERWWVRGVLALGAAAILWLTVKLYTYRLKRQKLELQELVRKRTRELEEKNAELLQTGEELLHANQQLAQQNEQLQALNAEKNDLLGIVSHDLRNPLSAIHGLAELIATELTENPQVRQVAQQIVKSSERMLELVTNLLDVSRLEQGGMQFLITSIDVAPIVQGIVWQYESLAAEKHIRLVYSVDAAEHTTQALVDEQAVMQVVENLVSNAVKYSPQGKRIEVRVRAGSAGYVRIEVQDEGPGLTEEDKKRLFGKFARLSARPTGGEHSTGLGLSIVKRMVEAMGGRVWCESEYSHGATFVVELPSAEL